VAAACSYGTQPFVFGGQDRANVLADVEALDAERGWLLQALLTTPRKYHSAVCFGRCASLPTCQPLH
jgi:hypothetical protein